MKRLLLYAHFNKKNSISDYVIYTIKEFRAIGVDIIFLSTSKLSDAKAKKDLSQYIDELVLVPNIGYDFYAWKIGITKFWDIIRKYDKLILLNSSVLGPMFNLGRFLSALDYLNKDLIGATENREKQYHIQSYFLYFSYTLFNSTCFKTYWDNLYPLNDRELTINNYEVKLTQYFMDNGYSTESYYKQHEDTNPTLHHPYGLLIKRVPFIKIQLLRDNPYNKRLFLITLFLRIKKIKGYLT
jgi:rhamnosyltransferase